MKIDTVGKGLALYALIGSCLLGLAIYFVATTVRLP